MSQINETILYMMQEMTKLPVQAKPSKKEPSQFKDMMEQHSQNANKDKVTDQKPETPSAQKPQTNEGQENPNQGTDEGQLESQMALAAMAMLTNPVVVVEEQTPVAAVTAPVEQVVAAVAPEAAPKVVEAEQSVPQTDLLPEQESLVDGEPELALQMEETTVQAPKQTVEMPKDSTAKTVEQVKPVQVQDTDSDQTVELEVMEPAQQRLFEDVKSIPVKVGETVSKSQDDQGESVMKQVMEPLTKALERGASRLEIRLNPGNLGNVKVELTRNADGTLHVVLSADNTRTQNLLEKHSFQLQNILTNQNQEPVRIVVQQQENPQHAEDQSRNNDQGGHPQQQRQQQQHQESQDFLQQLRLGLLPLDAETTFEERE